MSNKHECTQTDGFFMAFKGAFLLVGGLSYFGWELYTQDGHNSLKDVLLLIIATGAAGKGAGDIWYGTYLMRNGERD